MSRKCAICSLVCVSSFQGNIESLSVHNASAVAQHLSLVKTSMKEREEKSAKELNEELRVLKLALSQYKTEIDKMRSELVSQIQPVVEAVVKVEREVQRLQEGFGEMALLVQTLQATSYSGVFVWKIPEVIRRRHEARTGRTISLYSAPFYTSRHGYKLCLRLYMNGDGSGKGSHLSFFLTLMRGEFDSLLQWPFKQTVSLILLDQDRQRNIIQSFRPEPSSASFQRPRTEMNVASGCPNFAPLSVLDNSSYVKEDTMFLKCAIDISGLDAQ